MNNTLFQQRSVDNSWKECVPSAAETEQQPEAAATTSTDNVEAN